MQNVRIYLIYIIVIGAIYLMAFNPVFLPVAPIGLVKLTYAFLFLFLTAKYQKLLKIIYPSILIYIILIVYSLFIAINGGEGVGTIYTHIVDFIELFLLPMSLAVFLVDHKIPLPRCLFIVASLASLITISAFINPTFLQILRSSQPESPDVVSGAVNLAVRNFGFGSELSSGYGWVLGVILVYFAHSFRANWWFIFLTPLVCFAILVNARSGLVATMLGLVVFGIYSGGVRNLIRLLCVLSILIVIIAHIDFSFIGEGTALFIADFFLQLGDVFTGNAEDTYVGMYTGDQFILPENLFQWLFGRGKNLFHGIFGVGASDVGFLNDLALGGITYVLLLYSSFYKVFKSVTTKWLFVAFLLMAVALNVKGLFFHTNGCLRIMMLIALYEYLKGYEGENKIPIPINE